MNKESTTCFECGAKNGPEVPHAVRVREHLFEFSNGWLFANIPPESDPVAMCDRCMLEEIYPLARHLRQAIQRAGRDRQDG